MPSVAAGESFEIDLDAGDIVEIMTAADENFSGTRVISDENHPVAVFSGGECTFVLAYSCDHVENQMSGVRLWGMQFIASRVPAAHRHAGDVGLADLPRARTTPTSASTPPPRSRVCPRWTPP